LCLANTVHHAEQLLDVMAYLVSCVPALWTFVERPW
jgi:hypothetical protein